MLVNLIDQSQYSEILLFPRFVIRILDDFFILSDIVEFALAVQAFMFHQSLYNVALISGKITKVLVQIYMQGWLSE